MRTAQKLVIVAAVLIISCVVVQPSTALPGYCDLPGMCTGSNPSQVCTCPEGTLYEFTVVTCADHCDPD